MGKERTEMREMQEKKKRERNETVWKEMRANDSIDLNFKVMCKKNEREGEFQNEKKENQKNL